MVEAVIEVGYATVLTTVGFFLGRLYGEASAKQATWQLAFKRLKEACQAHEERCLYYEREAYSRGHSDGLNKRPADPEGLCVG